MKNLLNIETVAKLVVVVVAAAVVVILFNEKTDVYERTKKYCKIQILFSFENNKRYRWQ